MKNLVKVLVNKNLSIYDFEGKLKSVLALVQGEIEKIPQENVDSAEISFDMYDSYGSQAIDVEVYYWRDETDAEYQLRLNAENLALQQNKDRKMKEYLKLKAELEL